MKRTSRIKRHTKVRKKIIGTKDCPRLSVFRSGKHIYAQIIDDGIGKTLVAESDSKKDKGTKLEKAFEIGRKLAQKAVKKKISQVIFDRGGFLYHGRVAELARGAREGGLKF